MLPLQRRAQQPGAEDVTRFLLKNIPKRYQNAVDEFTSALHASGRYSINSSAATSRPAGMVKPIALAALALMAVSNFVGARTGRSAGLPPRRMRST